MKNYGTIRRLANGRWLPLVTINGGVLSDPPPGEPSSEDAHEAADRSRELSGVSAGERRRRYWESPAIAIDKEAP